MINNTLVNLYNNSMILAQQNQALDDTQKSIIIDSIGALLQSLNISDFNGTYSIDELKKDIGGLK